MLLAREADGLLELREGVGLTLAEVQALDAAAIEAEARQRAARTDPSGSRVERPWARLKERRAVAPRYGKTKASFLGVPCLAATAAWLRP